MAVPAEDERDWAFATLHGLPIVRTVAAARRAGRRDGRRGLHRRGREDQQRLPRRPRHRHGQGAGHRVARGARASASARSTTGCATGWSRASGSGAARSRSSTAPTHGVVPVPEDQLPVARARRRRVPADRAVAAGLHEGFLHTTCPICGGPARRETDTMDTFVDSSLVLPALLRPVEHRPALRPGGGPALDAGRPVHRRASSTPSCTCSTPASSPGPSIDVGLAPGRRARAVQALFAQGMIRMDGTKMSKSKGNLIAPEHYFETVGADALRLFHLFVGPPADDMDWTEQTEQVIEGCGRFLDRLWRTVHRPSPAPSAAGRADRGRPGGAPGRPPDDRGRDRATSSGGPTTPRWPTAWSCSTSCSATRGARATTARTRERAADEAARRAAARCWRPMTPHVTAELWELRHPGEPSVHLQPWPTFDPELVREETVTMVVQVNGKVRDRLEVDAGDRRGRGRARSRWPRPRWSRRWPGPRPRGSSSGRPGSSTSSSEPAAARPGGVSRCGSRPGRPATVSGSTL